MVKKFLLVEPPQSWHINTDKSIKYYNIILRPYEWCKNISFYVVQKVFLTIIRRVFQFFQSNVIRGKCTDFLTSLARGLTLTPSERCHKSCFTCVFGYHLAKKCCIYIFKKEHGRRLIYLFLIFSARDSTDFLSDRAPSKTQAGTSMIFRQITLRENDLTAYTDCIIISCCAGLFKDR